MSPVQRAERGASQPIIPCALTFRIFANKLKPNDAYFSCRPTMDCLSRAHLFFGEGNSYFLEGILIFFSGGHFVIFWRALCNFLEGTLDGGKKY